MCLASHLVVAYHRGRTNEWLAKEFQGVMTVADQIVCRVVKATEPAPFTSIPDGIVVSQDLLFLWKRTLEWRSALYGVTIPPETFATTTTLHHPAGFPIPRLQLVATDVFPASGAAGGFLLTWTLPA